MAKQRERTQTVWSSDDREEWITNAIQSSDERDIKDGYTYTKMLRNIDSVTEHVEDGKRGFVTACLAHAIYDNDASKQLRRMSICFYSALLNKMFNNSYLHLMYKRNNFIILMKGSNAYKLLLQQLPEQNDIEYSDLDIVIYINPHLDDNNFEQLKSSLIIMVSQVMSRYKKDLDALLFPAQTRTAHTSDIVSLEDIEKFKSSFQTLLQSFIPGAANEEPGLFHSPFEEDSQTRFKCSKRSFIIANSSIDDNLVVRVEVPHLDRCDCIPLRKTPLVLSHNMAIRFSRDIEGHYQADFDLLRLRLNVLYENLDTGEDTCAHEESDAQMPKKSYKIVPADFIDVSIPSKQDSELLHFWSSDGFNNCHEVYDETIETCITIPNVHECVRDLTNMLYVYTSNQNLVKYEKRLKRLELLKTLDAKDTN